MELVLDVGGTDYPLRMVEVSRKIDGFFEASCELEDDDEVDLGRLGEVAKENARGWTAVGRIVARRERDGERTQLAAPLSILDLRAAASGESHTTRVRLAALPAWDGTAARWRVLDGPHVRQLFEAFEDWLAIEASVSTKLAATSLAGSFAISGSSYVLQNGVSDWNFARALLEVASSTFGLPGVGIGARLDAGGCGYYAQWTDRSGLNELNDVWSAPPPSDAVSRVTLSFPHTCTESLDFLAAHPVPEPRACRTHTGTVEPGDLKDYLAQWLPVDDDGEFVDETTDVVRPSRTGDEELNWSSSRYLARSRRRSAVGAGGHSIAPVLACGRISDCSPKRDWVAVELEGFEAGANEVRARLAPVYAGLDGSAGVHLVPESGTHVWIAWDGYLGHPVLCPGNIRMSEVQEPSPYLNLEKELVAKLATVVAREVGLVTVESALSVKVQQDANFVAEQKVDVRVSEGLVGKVEQGGAALDSDKVRVSAQDSLALEAGKKLVAKGDQSSMIEGGGKEIKMKGGKVDIG